MNAGKDITSRSQIKDQVDGEKGTERCDTLEREAEAFNIGLLLKKARESCHRTHGELGQIVHFKN